MQDLEEAYRQLVRRQAGRGLLVSLEGIDGCGKSTQIRELEDFLRTRGIPHVGSREPTEGLHGRQIRNLLSEGRVPDREQARGLTRLFIRDRQEHVKGVILPSLLKGKLVLLDRYYHSSMAYQGAAGLDPQKIKEANEAFAPPPDLLLLFDIEVSLAAARRSGRGGPVDGFERHLEYQARVRRCYLDLLELPYVRSIPGHGSVTAIADKAQELLCELIRAGASVNGSWNSYVS